MIDEIRERFKNFQKQKAAGIPSAMRDVYLADVEELLREIDKRKPGKIQDVLIDGEELRQIARAGAKS